MGGTYKFRNFDETKSYELIVKIVVDKGFVTKLLKNFVVSTGVKFKLLSSEDISIDSSNFKIPTDVYKNASLMLNNRLWEIESDIRKRTGEDKFRFITTDLKKTKINKIGNSFTFEFTVGGSYHA